MEKYVLVQWPESQEIMCYDDFMENAVATDEPGSYLVYEEYYEMFINGELDNEEE